MSLSDTTSTLESRIRSQRRGTLIVNTRSRNGRRLYDRARDLLKRHRFNLDATYAVRDPARLPSIVREAVVHGTPLVIIGGGDGTISAIVDDLAYRDAALAILPLGTANSFARTLGIPLDVEQAVDVIVRGKLRDVDLGKVDDDYFANTAAFGLAAAIGRSRLIGAKRMLGRASYPLVGAIKFVTHRPFRCRFSTKAGTLIVDHALDVLIANGRYQGGVLVAPEASAKSGDLLIKVIKGPGKWNLAKAWALTAAGRREDPRLVETLRMNNVWIDADPPQYLSIDGEVVTRTPVRASVAPDALKVLVP